MFSEERRNEITEAIAKQIDMMLSGSKEMYDSGRSVDRYQCKRAVRFCLEGKAELIEMLSKHPKWDEENLRVHFDANYKRPQNPELANDRLRTLAREAHEVLRESGADAYSPFYTLARELVDSRSARAIFFDNSTLTPEAEEYLKRLLPDARAHAGQKTTRALLKLLRQYNWEESLRGARVQETTNPVTGEVVVKDALDRARKAYTDYADAMNELTVTRHTVLSVNPMDFLRMSHLAGGLRSCHYVSDDDSEGSGCYSAGCWSYAYDEQTLIFYTVEEGVDSDRVTYADKYTRELFFWNGSALLHSRVYPAEDNVSAHVYRDNRTIVEQIIADCCGFGNLWVKTKEQTSGNGIRTFSSGRHYPDYRHHAYHAYVPSFIAEDTAEDEFGNLLEFHIGCDDTICVCCGGEIDHDESPFCEDCSEAKTYYCDHCGYSYTEDEGEFVDGDFVCRGCLDEHYRWDEYGDCYIPDDRAVYVHGLGWTHENTATDNTDIYYCEHCGEYYWGADDKTIVDDYTICPDCLERHFAVCDRCGTWHEKSDMERLHSGDYVCADCVEEDEMTCTCCGRLHKADELILDDDESLIKQGLYCKECYETRRRECEHCGSVFYFDNDEEWFNKMGLRTDNHDTHLRVCQSCLAQDYWYDSRDRRYIPLLWLRSVGLLLIGATLIVPPGYYDPVPVGLAHLVKCMARSRSLASSIVFVCIPEDYLTEEDKNIPHSVIVLNGGIKVRSFATTHTDSKENELIKRYLNDRIQEIATDMNNRIA